MGSYPGIWPVLFGVLIAGLVAASPCLLRCLRGEDEEPAEPGPAPAAATPQPHPGADRPPFDTGGAVTLGPSTDRETA